MRRALLVLAALAALPCSAAAASPYSDAVTGTSGLVGYWRLGEAAGATALPAAGTALGTWSGAAQLGTPGALAGDDDAAVTLNGGAGLALGSTWAAAGDLTLEAWVAPQAASGTRYVLSKGSTTTGFQLYLTSSRQPSFSVGATGGTSTVTGSALAAGTWHHLAGTLRGLTLTLYVDGRPVATRAASGTVRRGTLPLVAGRYSQSSTGGLVGALDDVAVYDGGLSDAAVAAHAAAGIDPAPPGVGIALGPAGRTDQATAAFALSSTKSRVTYTCSLDGGAYASCASAPSYAGLGNAPHTLRVLATDRWGAASTAPAAWSWTIDPTAAADYTPEAPVTSITPAVAAVTASTDASFTLSASKDRTTFACSLDGAAFLTCGPAVRYTGLGAGDHTLRVRATDRFGQAETTPAAFSWKIDRTPPDTFALALAPPPGADQGAAVFAGTEPGSFQCRLGGQGDWAPCSAPLALPPGVTSVSVRAVDAAGNVDPSPTTVTLGEAPDGAEPTGAAAFASASAGLAFTATRGATLTCRLDDADWSSCASPLALDGLGWGAHSFAVRATYAGGTVLESPPATWTAAAPAPRIAALQFPVLLRRGRDGRARANGRTPALRFAVNVPAGVHLSIVRMKGASAARTLGVWSVKAKPGDTVVAVPDQVVRRLRRGRYRLVARAPGAPDVTRAFAVV